MLPLLVLALTVQELRPPGLAQQGLPDPPVVRLNALSAKELAAVKARAPEGPALTGTHRAVPSLMKAGKWRRLPGGAWIWQVRIQSMGAAGLRVHFQTLSAGTAWVYEHGGSSVEGPYTGREFWSGLIFGNSAVIEFVPTGGKKPGKLPFVVDRISHQFPRIR